MGRIIILPLFSFFFLLVAIATQGTAAYATQSPT